MNTQPTPPRRTVRRNIVLLRETYEKIKRIGAREERSAAFLIRRAVREYAERNEK